MAKTQDQLVTILGSAYFQPIADLIDRLLKKQRRRPDRIQSGMRENGYSAACVLLLVAMFESYVSRLRYIHGSKFNNSKHTALYVVFTAFPKLRHKNALTEVYVLRDLLTHSHLWEIEYEWGGSVPMKLINAKRHPGYGDTKFADRVNPKTQRTKALRLSAIPTRVDRTDVLKVFGTIWKTLLQFENANRSQCYVSHLNVQFRGQLVLFSSLYEELESAL